MTGKSPINIPALSGLNGSLLVVFVVLKLTGLISWSWWWVLSPIWIPLVIGAVFMIAVGVWWVLPSKNRDGD